MEQLIPQITGRWTEDEYLRMEEASKTRHELRGGRIVDMAGGTEPHSQIAANLIIAIGGRLRGTRCRAYTSDLRVRTVESGDYCYPDVTVACEPLEFHRPPSRTVLTNPRLVIEVTSESTEAEDRGQKFSGYRSIPSVQEYVLVSSVRRQVETFFKQPDGIWAIGATITDPAAAVTLRSVQLEVPLADIYDRVELPAVAPPVVSPRAE